MPAKLLHAIELMGRGYSKAETARRLQISDRTIRRWLVEFPDTQARIDERLEEFTSELSQSTIDLGHAAVPVLAALLNDDNPTIRLRAVAIALTHAGQRLDSLRIERQLDKVEDRRGATSSTWEAVDHD